jgi:hypothetical protein
MEKHAQGNPAWAHRGIPLLLESLVIGEICSEAFGLSINAYVYRRELG